MKRIALCFCAVLGLFANSFAIVPPKDGGKLPQAYYDAKAKNRKAFTLERAWVNKARALKEKREAFFASQGANRMPALPQDLAVSGTFYVPVLLGNFANTTAPYPGANLQTELFTGPWSPGTMTQYYTEVSYGNVVVTGSVFSWVTVSNNDTYYEGTSNGMGPGDAHTKEFIQEILDVRDVTVDFGQYDNDGPDGVPNSGDDDGFVDVIAVVHPEIGAECGGNMNIWSHSWSLSGWPELGYAPYTTNDAAHNGGFIMIDDYTIQPAKACDNSTMIQIGVFCHEFGHAFGLPDLYDTDGGTSGVGYWDLMGSGNWNTPASPAHMGAWPKAALGWVTPTTVAWQGLNAMIPQVEFNPVVYRLPFTDERWRRATDCAISGAASMRCGLSEAQGNTRNWLQGGGYGNLWNETVQHDFIFDGTTTPVTFSYDYDYETEADYDYAYTVLDVGGDVTFLTSYDGSGSGSESIDLSSILSAYTPPVRYRLRFGFNSDFAWSDEDGDFPTACGAFTVDNIGVAGGGENYSTGFEEYVDGWYQDPASNYTSEYWLVENRQKVGFDGQAIAAGLLFWHVDDEVMWSMLGNTGGGGFVSDNAVRGVVLEEADGDFDLINGTANRGDANDPFPGALSNTAFNTSSSPSSYNNTGSSTMIEVSGIGASGATMSAFLRGGDFAPDPSSAAPDTADNDQTAVAMIIDGFKMRQGVQFRFTKPGHAPIIPDTSIWIAPRRLIGTINVYSRKSGFWRLEVTNPDGQVDSVPNALYLNFKVATQLAAARLNALEDGIEFTFDLTKLDPGDEIVVLKAISPQGPWFEPAWSAEEISGFHYRFVDSGVEAGETYYYRVDVRSTDGAVRNLYQGAATLPPRELVLYQNYPNPFNPTTTITFYLPQKSHVDVAIYDVRGALVKTLAGDVLAAGMKSVFWDGLDEGGRRVGSGVYFYRLQAGKNILTRKMVLIK